jgi:hypothetical protein
MTANLLVKMRIVELYDEFHDAGLVTFIGDFHFQFLRRAQSSIEWG